MSQIIGIQDKGHNTVCPMCKTKGLTIPLHFRCLCGIRLYDIVGGRRRMSARCPECKADCLVDGGRARKDE